VLIIGDSGMVDESPALSAGFSAAGWRVVMGAYPGEGLTSPNPSVRSMWASFVVKYHPDLTVVMLGGWDMPFISQKGDAAYWAAIGDTVSKLTATGGRILWLSMLPGGTTPTRPPDRFYQQLPTRYPGLIDYFDIQSALAAPDGTWPRVVVGHLFRKPDDWHLCQDGAAALAHDILSHLGADGQSWNYGSWRASLLYNDPLGGCRT
jgi:hypothetical protein